MQIAHSTAENNNNLSISKLRINDNRNLSYFRKSIKPDKYLVKGPEKIYKIN